jgi:hypothetical protein
MAHDSQRRFKTITITFHKDGTIEVVIELT